MRLLTCLFAFLFVLLAAPQAHALLYSLTDLGLGPNSEADAINNSGMIAADTDGFPVQGYSYSGGINTSIGALGTIGAQAIGMNNAGTIVGGSAPPSSATHAFSWSGGVMTDLGTLGGAGGNTNAIAINDSGVVTGSSDPGTGNPLAFVYSGGTMTSIGTMGGSQSQGNGINNAGTITGYSNLTGDTASHAFSWSSGTFTDLGTLGGTNSIGNGINSSGMIVGESTLVGDTVAHAFLWNGGTMTDLGSFGGTVTLANSINSSGDIVGQSELAGNTATDGFIYTGGTMIDLNSVLDSSGAGWTVYFGTGINDSGLISAVGFKGGQSYAILLTPVPEPASLFTFTTGIILLGAVTRRRFRS